MTDHVNVNSEATAPNSGGMVQMEMPLSRKNEF